MKLINHLLDLYEIRVFENLCSLDIEDNKKGFLDLLNLHDTRRFILSNVIKTNSQGKAQINDIMSKCHHDHVNIAVKVYQPGRIAINKERLNRYLSA